MPVITHAYTCERFVVCDSQLKMFPQHKNKVGNSGLLTRPSRLCLTRSRTLALTHIYPYHLIPTPKPDTTLTPTLTPLPSRLRPVLLPHMGSLWEDFSARSIEQNGLCVCSCCARPVRELQGIGEILCVCAKSRTLLSLDDRSE